MIRLVLFLGFIAAMTLGLAWLADRRIGRTGSPQEMRARPEHPWIMDYFCGERGRAATAGRG